MLKKDVFFVKGLDCQDEIALLKKILEKKSGILQLSFDVLSEKMIVEYERSQISPSQIIKLIKKGGFKASLFSQKTALKKEGFFSRHSRWIMVVFSGIFLLLGFLSSHYLSQAVVKSFFHKSFRPYSPFIPFSMYFLSLVFGLWYVVPKAFYSVKRIRGDMNLLMIIAVLGALFIDQWFEAASVAFLFSLALVLEHGCIHRARREIHKLMDLSSKVAYVIQGESVKPVEVQSLKVKDKILVKPGEKIPIDAKIIQGSSFVNEAPITGEAYPVKKEIGDDIFAGTINKDSPLECEVVKPYSETMLAKMTLLIEQAHAKKAKTERWIESFASIYTPIMIILALAVALIPPLVYQLYWLTWIYKALVILVIACPCALVISTPVTIVAALTSAARFGVLIKGGIFLEIPSQIKAIAFDKTGTITEGFLKVQKIISINNHLEEEIIQLAHALEKVSTHPLARAVVEYAEEKKIDMKKADHVVEFQGKGLEGFIEGKKYFIGSHKFLHEKKMESLKMHKKAVELEEEGYTVLVLGDEKQVLALIALSDKPRHHMHAMLSELKELGVEKSVMLTGDNTKSAQMIAQKVGIDEFYSELLPEEKVEAIENLKQKYHMVAMVGDGINDAPALASASVGIAMGAMGSDIAIESSDIALMTEDVGKIAWLIRHSKKALKVIKQNVVFSLAVKGIFLVLAILGFASLWMAIAADTGASLLVIFNGLRLLSCKEK